MKAAKTRKQAKRQTKRQAAKTKRQAKFRELLALGKQALREKQRQAKRRATKPCVCGVRDFARVHTAALAPFQAQCLYVAFASSEPAQCGSGAVLSVAADITTFLKWLQTLQQQDFGRLAFPRVETVFHSLRTRPDRLNDLWWDIERYVQQGSHFVRGVCIQRALDQLLY